MNSSERLKVLAAALRLTRHDIARAATLGGVPTSINRADSCLRAANSTKRGQGKFGEPRRRATEFSDEEFDAVLLGLAGLLSEIEADANQDVDREN